jgi:small subunit ribosomal protein S6
MRTYECTFILNPTLDEATVAAKIERFSEIVTSRKGTIRNIDRWGKRKLAYPILKTYEGNYTLMRFTGGTEILAELSRVFRFDDDVIRHLIVVDESPAAAAEPAQPETEQ